VLTIKGKHHYLWRAVDQDGQALDILVQSWRNRQAAKRFFRKLLKGLRYAPRVLITDKLKSYAAAKVQIMPGVEHRQHKGLNNRAGLSHQPTRQRERQCAASSHPAMHSGFCRRTARSTMLSGASATAYRRGSTGTSALKHFQSGMRSPM
jgi:transposase-like protein